MAYLITCAGCKTKPTTANPSHLNQLSFNDTLFQARSRMIDLAEVTLDWNFTLPAWRLYSGKMSKLYPQVSPLNWGKPCVEINILSALFGWIKHTDQIPHYDLKMDDRRGESNQFIWQMWHDMDVLGKQVSPNDIDLLSQVYRKAVHSDSSAIALEPPIRFTDRGVQKGIWLNNQLTNIILGGS